MGGADRADPARLVRDAVEPAPQGHRHRRGRGDDPRAGRAGGRRAAAARRRQHVRLAGAPAPARRSAPTSCSTRRRSTSAATRTRSSASPSRATTRSPSGCASSRTRWAACPGRSTASSSCAGCGRCRCASSGTPRTRSAVARFLADRDDVEWVFYPGLADGPHAHPRRGRRPRQMRGDVRRRHGLVRARRRGGGTGDRRRERASRSARRPGSSPWPSRSAASSR